MEGDSPEAEFLHSTVDSATGKPLQRAECIYCNHVIVSKTWKGLLIAEKAHQASCPLKPKR
jgi:hypothetical protein